MAHSLTQRANGVYEMAYVGEKPWHGLGQELQSGASIETWQKAAGMDWTIQRSVIRYATDRDAKKFGEYPDWHVAMRSDTKAPLGIVSDGFKFVQPQQVLEFFRDLTEAAGFRLETAGTLNGGTKFWAMASIDAQDRIVGKDMVKGKLLFATACDGKMKSTVKNVAERVVCANTLAIAFGEGGAPVIEVSHRSHFDAVAVKKELGISVESFHKFITEARSLANCKITQKAAEKFVADLLVNATGFAIAAENVQEDRHFKNILELFNGAGRGADMPGVKGTAWGLVNSVTEYVDHSDKLVRAKDDATRQNNRIDSAWFGRGSDLKTAAMEKALELI